MQRTLCPGLGYLPSKLSLLQIEQINNLSFILGWQQVTPPTVEGKKMGLRNKVAIITGAHK